MEARREREREREREESRQGETERDIQTDRQKDHNYNPEKWKRPYVWLHSRHQHCTKNKTTTISLTKHSHAKRSQILQ